MLPRGDLMYRAYYQYKTRELAPKSVQSSYSLPLPTSTSTPSIPMLEQVVPYVPSSSRVEDKPIPPNRPSHLPRPA